MNLYYTDDASIGKIQCKVTHFFPTPYNFSSEITSPHPQLFH